MTESEKVKSTSETDLIMPSATGPVVFISHDSRDAELAEALSKLLKSVSAGMLKTFRSSDKKGTEGIDFGEEWYKKLMTKLQTTSDVVCLFTERSLDRPWILFEAGVAKGKLNTPVVGIALGVPLSRVGTGPFYQFQNMDDSETDLIKLVHQLARRIPSLELDQDVVKTQVTAFKKTEGEILKKISTKEGKKESVEAEESPVAKLVEEMKALPSRVAERLSESADPMRRRRMRRFHPRIIDQLMHIAGGSDDPVGILIAASLIRDDFPWLYELTLEVYRAIKTGDMDTINREVNRFQNASEFLMHSPLMEEFGMVDKDMYMFCMEFPRMVHHMLERYYNIPLKHNVALKRRRINQPAPKQ